MLCGVDGAGVATTGPVYLATYTYRVPLTAAGDFVMDIRRDEAAGDQTFLIASGNGRIEVGATTPGVIGAIPAVVSVTDSCPRGHGDATQDGRTHRERV